LGRAAGRGAVEDRLGDILDNGGVSRESFELTESVPLLCGGRVSSLLALSDVASGHIAISASHFNLGPIHAALPAT
jgi:hypothetical protein